VTRLHFPPQVWATKDRAQISVAHFTLGYETMYLTRREAKALIKRLSKVLEKKK
jgi:hypothetical protein